MNWKKVSAAALGGLALAIRLDYHAWKQNPTLKFDWYAALPRYIQGAFLGALTAIGLMASE